jgi:Ran GTPase-activating protein (RanGAP) involved in mRNA processing and transport
MSDNDSTDNSDVGSLEDSAVIDTKVERILNNDATLTNIDYCYDHVSEETLRRLVEALYNNVMVDWLALTGCDLTMNSAKAIGQLFRRNRRISHLLLSNNSSMGSEGIIAIMEGLCENRKLRSIMMEDNGIGATELFSISHMLRLNNTLEELSLGWNELPNDEQFVDFTLSLASSRSLVRLELGNCALESRSVQNLFEHIKNHPTITYLDLTGNRINSDISESFGKLLRQNRSLRSISISNNSLGSRTAAAVALALEENTTLQSLVMGNNGIDDEGALALSRALPRLTGLYDLSLHNNTLTSKGGEALISAMELNRSLRSISLGSRTFVLTPRMRQMITFYKRRNRIGWPTLESPSLTLALWPLILAKLSSKPRMAHFFLCQVPTIISHSNAVTG